MGEKFCNKCQTLKPISEFCKYKEGSKRKGYRYACKKCLTALANSWKSKNKEKYDKYREGYVNNPETKKRAKFNSIKHEYGLSKDEWYKILKSQGNCCALCKESSDELTFYQVDHCHETGKIRGILCRRCNLVLGCAKDKIETIKNALIYLKKHKN